MLVGFNSESRPIPASGNKCAGLSRCQSDATSGRGIGVRALRLEAGDAASFLARYHFPKSRGQGEHPWPVRVQRRHHLGHNAFFPTGQRSRALPPVCKSTRLRYAPTCRVAVEDQVVHVVTEYEAVLDGLSCT